MFTCGSSFFRSNGVAPDIDPYFSNVTLLLQGSGTVGQPPTIDDSTYHHTLTNNNVLLSNTQTKFGLPSMRYNGTYSYTKVPTLHKTFTDKMTFTCELFLWVDSLSGDGRFISDDNASYPSGLMFRRMGSSLDFTGTSTHMAWNISGTTSSVLIAQQWQHIALVRDAGVFRIYVDGINVLTNTSYISTNIVEYYSNTPPIIGTDASYISDYLNGYIGPMRITDGVARYNANFTPPSKKFPTQ